MNCGCRKPQPGLLLRAAQELDLDLGASIMFGDKPGDCTAGRTAGCPEHVLLGTDGKALPDIASSPDATRSSRSLAEAVASPWFKEIAQ